MKEVKKLNDYSSFLFAYIDEYKDDEERKLERYCLLELS